MCSQHTVVRLSRRGHLLPNGGIYIVVYDHSSHGQKRRQPQRRSTRGGKRRGNAWAKAIELDSIVRRTRVCVGNRNRLKWIKIRV